MATGILSGALLGALDVFGMVFMARRAFGLGVARASACMRWGVLVRFLCIAGGLVLGAATLGRSAFLWMAGAYVVVRIVGLLVIASGATPGGGKAASTPAVDPRRAML